MRAAGGDVDVGEDGQVIYKFDDVQGELFASEQQRQAASRAEMSPGEVVFSSEDDGPGMRDERTGGRAGGRSDMSAPGKSPPARPALPEKGEVIPDSARDKESVEELLSRIGVDTRRRGG